MRTPPGRHDDGTLGSADRLADLERSGLLDPDAQGALDALMAVAHSALGADTSTAITAVTADSQIIVSRRSTDGLDLVGASAPLSHSLCKFAVTSEKPYVVDDATLDPAHEAVARDFGVGAYAGFPLHGPLGTVLGAVCATTRTTRQWSAVDLQVLKSLTTAAEFVVGMVAMTRRDRLAQRGGAVPVEPLARIQHGLRTPLAGLLGFLELLLDGSVGDFTSEQVAALERCQGNALRLRDAVQALV